MEAACFKEHLLLTGREGGGSRLSRDEKPGGGPIYPVKRT